MRPPVMEEMLPISLSMLRASSAPGIDVYWLPRDNESPLLFCTADDEICGPRLEQLVQEGTTRLYIHSHDRDMYQEYIRASWQDVIADSSQTLTDRMSIMTDVIRDVLSEKFASGNTESIVKTCQLFGTASVQLLSSEPVLVRELVKVLHHDYGTFTHSANVSAYAVLLAKELGYEQEDLERIAIGGLLHDIGKLEIDEKILNKPGRLDDLERRVIEQHPTLGLLQVAHREDLSEGELMMIYQHHERLQGQGYPVGVSGKDIHPWAKICGIVDVYEALTSARPYRQALSAQTALTILEKGESTEFDKEMLACWRRLLQS